MPVTKKSDVLWEFQKWLVLVERQAKKSVLMLRSDRGGEFLGKEFTDFVDGKGIVRNLTCPNTPQQNGMAEREMRTAVESVRTMLLHMGVQHHWWHLALRQAVWMRNCLERSTTPPGTAPYQVLTGKKTDLTLARVWGCMVQFMVPEQQRSRKLAPKARWGLHLGVSPESKGWEVLDLTNNKVVTSVEVIFYKTLSLEVWMAKFGPASGRTQEHPLTDTSTATVPLLAEVDETADEDVVQTGDLVEQEAAAGVQSTGELSKSAGSKQLVDNLAVDQEEELSAGEESTVSDVVEVPITKPELRRTGRARRPPERLSFHACLPPAAFTAVYVEVDNDLLYDDAEEDEELPELDPDVHADPEHRWDIATMTVKEAPASWKGEAVKFAMEEEIRSLIGMGTWKLVERPHHEESVCGANYDKTYSPASSYVTLRIFLSILAVLDLNLMQLDMKNAFLQSKLDRVLYMALDGVLLGAGWKKSQVDEALCFKASDIGVTCWVLVYVNDLLATSSSPTMLKELLEVAFELSEISPIVKYLGQEILRDRPARKLWIHQQGYADKLRRRFIDQEQGDQVRKTPVSVHAYAERTFDDEEAQEHEEEEYRQKVGSLQFASLELIGYVDADDVGDMQKRTSTSGYVFVYEGAAVSWSSSRIKCATLSSTESEYVAATNAGKEERGGRGAGGSGEAQAQGQPRHSAMAPMQPGLGPPRDEPRVFGLDKFNGDNFAQWSFKMEIIFDHSDLLEVMEGTEKRPENDPEKSPWVRKSAQCYLLQGQAFESSQIRHIKPFQREPEKGPKAWAALKGVHAPATAAVAVVLERQMAALRIEEDEAWQQASAEGMAVEGAEDEGEADLAATTSIEDAGVADTAAITRATDAVAADSTASATIVTRADICGFTRYPFSSSEATAKAPLDEVVMDVVGPLKLGAAGAEYFLTIVDVYTRMTWVYVLSKTDWLPMVERQQDRFVKVIRTDRGGEFLSKEFSLWLKKNGIRNSLTMPYSPAMNGIAERANRTITETARGLLIEAGLPDYFWPDAVRKEAKDAEEEEEKVQQVSERAPTLPSRTTCAPRIQVTPQQRQGLRVLAAEEEGRGKRRIQAPNRLTTESLGKPAKSALARAALIVGDDEESDWEECAFAFFFPKAMESELKRIEENGTWELVELPEGRKAITSKWLFKIKSNADGKIERYKSRPVAKGYQQKEKVESKELFAPVVKLTTLRALLAGAAIKGWVVKQMDVTTAFLNGILEEEIFMAQPEGFTPSSADHSLFMLGEGEQRSFMVVYVDDILIFSPSSDLVKEVMLKLQDKFKCKALGDVSFYLGLHIERDVEKRCMRVHQRNYLEALAANFGQSEGHVATSFPSAFKCVKGPEEESVGEEERHRFHSLVGSLMYAAVNTRLDVAFATGQLARVVQCPNEEQVAARMRVAKYLGQTLTIGLQYSAAAQRRQKGADGVEPGRLFVTAFSDASYASEPEDMTSVGGFICCVCEGLTAWESKKQVDQALSSVESEYMALFRAVREIVWQRRLLAELGEEQQGPTPLYCDSQGAIALAKNPVLHGLTKHMRVKWHWTRSMVAASEVELHYVKTTRQPADMMTKRLVEQQHWKLAAIVPFVQTNVASSILDEIVRLNLPPARPGKPTILRVDNKSAITVTTGLGLTGNLKHTERRYALLQHMVRHGKFVLKYIPTTEQPTDFVTKALHFPAFNQCSVAIGQVRLADVGDGDDDVQQ
ncbi:unnamed protein product [Closterium sp. NIES-54]